MNKEYEIWPGVLHCWSLIQDSVNPSAGSQMDMFESEYFTVDTSIDIHSPGIATDKALFSSENCWYLSYFSIKTYVVGTH